MGQGYIAKEDRQSGLNFSGAEFMFCRSYESSEGTADFEVGVHNHEWHEFVWARFPPKPAGPRHVYSLDGRSLVFPSHSLLYSPPFHPHAFFVSGPLSTVVLGIDQTKLCRAFAHTPLARPLEALFLGWSGLPACIAPSASQAGKALARIMAKAAKAPPTGDYLESLAFLATLQRTLRAWETPASQASDTESAQATVRSAMLFLERNFSQSPGVASCAAGIGVSRSKLSHSFRSITGHSLPESLNEIKIRHAKTLLAETDLEVMEIALECGFSNQAWFSRRFKSMVGESPSDFRFRSREMHKKSKSRHDAAGPGGGKPGIVSE